MHNISPGIEWDQKKDKVDSQTGFFEEAHNDFLDQKLMIKTNIYVVKENGLKHRDKISLSPRKGSANEHLENRRTFIVRSTFKVESGYLVFFR